MSVGAFWSRLAPAQRLVAVLALALFVSLLLPWYSATVLVDGRPDDVTKSAFGAFSFVEAAILLVAVALLVLLWQRAKGAAFHLPGGDPFVVQLAGGWVAFLVFYRQFDKPDIELAVAKGVSWGIFVTLLLGVALIGAGQRLRAAGLAEPALPGDPDPTDVPVRRRRPRESRAPAEPPTTAMPPMDAAAETSVAQRRTPQLGRDAAARDLGRVGAAPDPDAPTSRMPAAGRRRRRRPQDEDDEPEQLSFDA